MIYLTHTGALRAVRSGIHPPISRGDATDIIIIYIITFFVYFDNENKF